MSRKVFLNGDYLDENEAKISIFDRGVLFADSVYEVTAFIENKLIDFKAHLERLERSLKEINIEYNLDYDRFLEIHKNLIRLNNLENTEGLIYFQISRGNIDRDFLIKDQKIKPNVFSFTQKKSLTNDPKIEKGLHIISLEDLRWKRRDIKTTQLLYPSIAKTKAIRMGADDAWLLDENGKVTEGTSNNAYIISNDTVITRQLSNDILHGITRRTILQVSNGLKLKVEERPFDIEEAKNSQEAFITSASTLIAPVIKINDKIIGNGTIGPITKILRETYVKISIKNGI
tara:strand:+ start:606 stop:1469 length:864 start_codon:yes stop_codon:yes gene_type:complete